jgi:hypothetical protein
MGEGEVILATIPRRLFRLATLHVLIWNFFGHLRRSTVNGNQDYEPNHAEQEAFPRDAGRRAPTIGCFPPTRAVA